MSIASDRARARAGSAACGPTASRPRSGRSSRRTRRAPSAARPAARQPSRSPTSSVVPVGGLDGRHARAAARTASKIFWYPVQRQRFPESASRISSSVGLGVCSSRSTVAHDQPRRAEAALHGAGGDECLLHAMQRPVGGDALDGHDLVPVGLRGEDEARADEHAVEQHRARPALPLLAGVLRARQAELLAQREEEALATPDVGLVALAVDGQRDLHARHLSSARRVSTSSAWRR